jgi:hypothetical protein
MHLTPSDPDIATLIRKINQGRLDLQPNFQRGEVWGKAKKQRLIDSILRGWHIPPVHVIQVPNSDKQEVLDGQQRLAAIRDFLGGDFRINGNQEPQENRILDLEGLSWKDLPKEIASKIEDFTIRVLTISDYKPGEPGELFYRLNQPTNLTSAEQRNAYFGEARQQVKELSEHMINLGFERETLGFSNSRMAYDDVISKLLLTLELETLRKKITANTVTTRYRNSTGFSDELIESVSKVLSAFYSCIKACETPAKLNKASAISWLIFIFIYLKYFEKTDALVEYFEYFEGIKKGVTEPFPDKTASNHLSKGLVDTILDIYQDRSSSRVADTSSVVLRDISLWACFVSSRPNELGKNEQLKALHRAMREFENLSSSTATERNFEEIAANLQWGMRL